MTKGKSLSIGAAMKNRMQNQGEAAEGTEREEESVLNRDKFQWKEGDITITPGPGHQVSDDPLESFNTRLPRSLQRRLKVYTAQEGSKIQDVVQAALDEYLGKKERK